MDLFTLFADFNNTDKEGRIRLNTKGTIEDIAKSKIELSIGLSLRLDDNDGLTAKATVEFSETENIWVARIDHYEN